MNRRVLSGLDLDVVPGEVLAIVGPNGSGKTTLLRTLLGLIDPLGGDVSNSGLPPKGLPQQTRARLFGGRPIGLLILDEPESGLDPGQRIRLRNRIETLRGGMTILVASPDLGEMAMMSDRVLLMDQGWGRVIEQPEGGFTRDFLEEKFQGLEGAVS